MSIQVEWLDVLEKKQIPFGSPHDCPKTHIVFLSSQVNREILCKCEWISLIVPCDFRNLDHMLLHS